MLVGTMVVAGGASISKVSADEAGEASNMYEWVQPEQGEESKSLFSKVRGAHKLHHKKEHAKNHFENLDEETQAQLKTIREQVQNEEITKEEAKQKLEELGITKGAHILFHKKAHFLNDFKQLDEDTQAKIKEIHEQVQNGELTKEEAKVKLEELGITKENHRMFHKKRHMMKDFKELDDATKAKVLEIREQVKNEEITKEEAREKLNELGITNENHKRFHQKQHLKKHMQNLDEETKQKLSSIKEQAKNGEITKEEAKAQIKAILKDLKETNE